MPATWAKIAYMMNNEAKVPVNRPGTHTHKVRSEYRFNIWGVKL
jgi:hypothetical protein